MYLLVVTGLSGAGKSLALKSMEERGYYTVDNLPSNMLNQFVELCENATPPITKAAVAVDSRESLLSRSSESMASFIDSVPCDKEILFLDCRDDVLKKRYNEVRRRHPLGDAGDAGTGVAREREYLQHMRNRATYILDTSDVSPRDFPKLIAKVLPEFESGAMTLLFCSFGYKRGVPIDADFVLDTRFIPNPFYVPELRDKSGMDKEVADYVFSQDSAREFMDVFEKQLRILMPLYQEQGKTILRVCFGCTGGRHRSVAAAEEMAKRFSGSDLHVRVYHRDLVTEAQDIQARFRDGN